MIASLSRHEYKYVISHKSAELLKQQLNALLRLDCHAGVDGSYFVRSVYFDDATLSSFRDKLNGAKCRNKYRLRCYKMNMERFSFEAKRKYDRLIMKDSTVVTRQLAEVMLSGGRLNQAERHDALLAEFHALAALGCMQPCVIVDYDRIAYTYEPDNIRITLDYDVRAEAYRFQNVFEQRASIPVLENNEVVLEIKYGEHLPAFIAGALAGVPKLLCAHSKYCNCLDVYQ